MVNNPLETQKMIDAMKVSELKDALREKKATLSGRKVDLVLRLKNLVGSDFIWITRTQEEVDKETDAAGALAASGSGTNSENNSPSDATDSGCVWMIQDGSVIKVPEGISATEGALGGFCYQLIVMEGSPLLHGKFFWLKRK